MSDEAPSHAAEIERLGRERAEDIVYRHLTLDGSTREITGGWLARRSAQLADALQERGLGCGLGDRLSLALRNSPEFAASALAAWRLGAIPIPVRWDVPDWELTRLLEVINPRVHLQPSDLPWIEASGSRAVREFPEVVAPHVQGICSSGSTGSPKVILASAAARLHPAFVTPMAQTWMPITRPQRIMVLAPMYHVNAFTTLHNMLYGEDLVVLEKFDAGHALAAIEEHRITTFTATPTMLQRMADHPSAATCDLSSLVWIQQGAAPMPPSLVRRWADLIGAEKIVMAYGMTEALGITALRGDEYLLHEGSVGRGMRGTEIKILDPSGESVPLGEVGDIYLRSPAYQGSHYLGEAPQVPSTDDGYRSVGDMGYLDADGYLYLVDRRVDLIITGGANVFPAEIEKALIDHPKVADVVVIGLLDEQWGRRVHAIIEPVDSSNPPRLDDVRDFARSRLAAYKIPKTIEIIDAIPRSEATKVNRGRLVEARGG